jgi:hypothetical protein
LFKSTDSWAKSERSKYNCFVTTETLYKNDEKKSKISRFRFEKESDCKDITRTLSENFDPDKIQKINSKYEWRGP